MITQKLHQLMENIWQVTKDIDLIYSEYDEYQSGKGWYLQKFPGGLTSDLFRTDNEAVKALQNGKVIFKEKTRKY